MISPVFGNRRLTPSGKSPPAHEQNRLLVGAPSLPSPIAGIARYSVELKRRFAIVGAVALIIVSALVFWLNRGPRYEGKPASYWVEQLLHDNAKARQALQKIGPAAVPALAEVVNRRRGRVMHWPPRPRSRRGRCRAGQGVERCHPRSAELRGDRPRPDRSAGQRRASRTRSRAAPE